MLVKQSRLPMRQIVTEGILPPPLKIALYRSRGARIGKNVSIGLGTVLVAEHLEIGDDTHIGFGTVLRGRGADVPGFGSVIGADLPGLGDVGALVLLEPDRSVTREAGGSAEVGAIQLAAGERVLVDGSRWAALEPVPRFERADGPGRCSFCRGRTAAGSRVRICEEGHRSCADGCGEEGCPWCAGPAEGVA